MLYYNTKLKRYSRKLRMNMTDAERLLWSRLRGRQSKGLQVYRQRIIGNYIVDFYCPKAKLVIEVDGGQHYTEEGIEENKSRDKYMREQGLKVLRFSDKEVFVNLEEVLERIYGVIPPIPPLEKGGEGGFERVFSSEKGTILITMLLLMVIITLIGVIAINTATVDVQISGNLKRATTAFEGAEAGVDLSIPIIGNTLAAGQLTTSSTTTSTTIGGLATLNDATTNLGNEILNEPSVSPSTFDSDISISNLGGVAVEVDIDRLYVEYVKGAGIAFAEGSEGRGTGAGAGGTAILYRIDSQGTM